jgi:hypothetical protein
VRLSSNLYADDSILIAQSAEVRDARRNPSPRPPWCFSEEEREDQTWSTTDDVPKAADVIGELGASLAATLSFALLVCTWLSADGIPAP